MDSVFGTWRLVRAVATAADGSVLPEPYGGKPMGRVVLGADGRMMAMTGDGRKSIPAGETREYSTYCGNYTYDGKILLRAARLYQGQTTNFRSQGGGFAPVFVGAAVPGGNGARASACGRSCH